MSLRNDLYKDINRLYRRKIARTRFLREKSLEAIKEGRLPAGLGERTRDVIRWILEDREMRLRRKRDLQVLYSEWQTDKEERRSELNALFDEFAWEREETRANWQRVQAKVSEGKALVAGKGRVEIARVDGGQAQESGIEGQPPGGSGEDESREKDWQIGEGW